MAERGKGLTVGIKDNKRMLWIVLPEGNINLIRTNSQKGPVKDVILRGCSVNLPVSKNKTLLRLLFSKRWWCSNLISYLRPRFAHKSNPK